MFSRALIEQAWSSPYVCNVGNVEVISTSGAIIRYIHDEIVRPGLGVPMDSIKTVEHNKELVSFE